MDLNVSQQLYCLECILWQENTLSLSPNLKTIPDLLDAQNRKNVRISEKVPQEYLDLLSKHIEDEQKKVSSVFDVIMQDMVKMISEKKNEYLYELDQQLFSMRCLYTFFNKQITKTYPAEGHSLLISIQRRSCYQAWQDH